MKRGYWLLILATLLASSASAQNVLTVKSTEDYYAGDATYSLKVDGVTVTSSQVCTARGGATATPQVNTFSGNWPPNVAHTVTIAFTNDAYGGPGLDRNLYVQAVLLDGNPATGPSAGTWEFYANGAQNWTTKVSAPPTTPTLTVVSATVTLTAPATTAHTVVLTWQASGSPGVTGYTVYRSVSNGSGYAKIGVVTATTLTYGDPTVAKGTTYYYVVTAVAPGAESPFSNQASAVIP